MFLESSVVGVSIKMPDVVPKPSQTKTFYFPKVHNELGKVTEFGTSRPLFSKRNGRLKKVQSDSAPPRPRVNPISITDLSIQTQQDNLKMATRIPTKLAELLPVFQHKLNKPFLEEECRELPSSHVSSLTNFQQQILKLRWVKLFQIPSFYPNLVEFA